MANVFFIGKLDQTIIGVLFSKYISSTVKPRCVVTLSRVKPWSNLEKILDYVKLILTLEP